MGNTNTERLPEQILESARALENEIIDMRRTIHQNPETGKNLPRTKAFVMKKLKEFGYEPKEICESGIVAEITGPNPGKVFLLRADMDGLIIQEKAGVSFRSENGRMHACGHDMHTAMLLGAARLLKQYQDQIKGTVKLVFQPDEEGFTGAKSMLAAGVLENPKVDAGMALHVNSGTPTGMVLCGSGTCMAGCTLFRIHVKGTGCHGAMPETGVDPLNIAAHIYLALQEITSREIGAREPAVVTIGRFSGGDAPNIIHQEVVMEGTIRTMDRDLSAHILTRISEIATGTAALFRGEASVTEIASAPPLKNDPDMIEELAGYVRKLTDEKKVIVFREGGMGSEDFASYTYEIPCAYLLLGAGTAQEDPLYGKPMHNECVVFNEAILPLGAAMHTWCAIRWLKEHSAEA